MDTRNGHTEAGGAVVSHTVNGDRSLITLELPREALTIGGASGRIGLTLDDVDWRAAAKLVIRRADAVERAMDPDALARRVEAALHDGVARALAGDRLVDPAVQRRQAVANVLRRCADMVLSGALDRVDVLWDRADDQMKIEVNLRTPARDVRGVYRLMPSTEQPA